MQRFSLRQEAVAILDPLDRATSAAADDRSRATAPRPASLEGLTLAVLDNGTRQDLTRRLVERMRERFRLADVIVVLKDTVNVPPRPEDWQEVTKRGNVGLALYGA